mgnify:CR=1 FL=1
MARKVVLQLVEFFLANLDLRFCREDALGTRALLHERESRQRDIDRQLRANGLAYQPEGSETSHRQRSLDLLPVLFKRELDQQQVGLALGECIAHLNYLHQRGQMERLEDQEGRYRYRSVDDTLPLRLRKHRHEAELLPPVQV